MLKIKRKFLRDHMTFKLIFERNTNWLVSVGYTITFCYI
ncbi:hypothetical protein P278_16010 [Zhouia amylolytica AD3]|uniref:Uncharacterized protein n=1 Tax=Zhouia amylolytica AD3 TaxID=1286632 RepID=W2UPL2_9FLAO|nr:hypothetical protein P278_16010 [Zhouia amylolytica AD3]